MIPLSLLFLLLRQADAAAPVEQPIPFSHKLHAGRGLKCAFCHPMKDPGEAAGLPKAAECLGCHESLASGSAVVGALASSRAEGVAWQRIYRLPSFVVFSHRRHADAGAGCERCHGAVAERDSLAREGDISMKACLGCHRERKAATACNSCHELER